MNLGRDALSNGDRILAENYYQHADHYQRVMNAGKPARPHARSTPHPKDHNKNDEIAVEITTDSDEVAQDDTITTVAS